MLLPLQQFLIKQAIRNNSHLLNSPVINIENIKLPKQSVIHYLDLTDGVQFPIRTLSYFNDISSAKKIPVFNITDLLYKEQTANKLDRTVEQKVKKWRQANLKDFKVVNLLEVPNQDFNLISVYNYNLLKELYKYKPSMLSAHYEFTNLYYTYWNYVKKAISKDTVSVHIVRYELPNHIPSIPTINMLNRANISKYYRVVTDYNLLRVIDIFRWLDDTTKDKSTLKDITDEEANRIYLELTYKGKSAFLPLYLIRSLVKESTLPNKIKLPSWKVQKLFLLSLVNLQNKINDIISKEEELTSDNIEESNKEEEVIDVNNETEEETTDRISNLNINKNVKKKEPLIQDLTDDQLGSNTVSNLDNDKLNSAIGNDLSELSEIDEVGELDEIYINALSEDEEPVEEESPIIINNNPEYLEELTKTKTIDELYTSYVDITKKTKTHTAQELRTLKTLYENRLKLTSPYNKENIDTYKQVTKENIELNKTNIIINNNIIPDNLKTNVISVFDNKYVSDVMKKDIVACILDLEKAEIIVKDYTVESNKSILGEYETHRVTLKPLRGKESTVSFRIPKIDSEGEMTVSGIRTRLRKQRTDLPIRKISPTRVALTSNYGKTFIFRTDRKSFSDIDYIVSITKKNYLNKTNNVLNVTSGNNYSNTRKLPNIYTAMSMHFNSITTTKYTLNFKYEDIRNFIDDVTLTDITNKQLVPIGYSSNKAILVVDYKDQIYDYSNNMVHLGDIIEVLDIDREKVPSNYACIMVLGDDIPIGIVLSYYLGLSNLISLMNITYEIIETGKRYTPKPNDIVIKFKDYKLVLHSTTEQQRLIFNGYLYYKNFIKHYELKQFNSKDVYLNISEGRNASLIHLKEINIQRELFLDAITVDVLKQMGEPTDYIKLLLRAVEMLSDYTHPDINDPNYSRLRGFDRVPGLMYRAISESVREFKIKGRSNSKIELDPYKVWNYITQDNTNKITEDNNPIVDMKENEAVTLTGADGLSKDATPKYLRRFHKNDTGFISEATVDSGDVALNIFLSPYAKLDNLRGLVNKDSTEHIENKSKLFSSSSMLTPGVENDDSKRIGFISVQNGHTIATIGYKQPMLRTGYEYVVPYKVGKLYASMAKQDGIVVDKTDKGLTVRYKDNSTDTLPIGKRYGRMEGGVYPHTLVTDLVVNAKFKEGDPLTYNSAFFERDWLDKSRILFKTNRVVTTAMSLTNEVFEDGSAVSKELSKDATSNMIKELSFVIEFDRHILNVLPEGTPTHPTDVLFMVLDESTDHTNLSESAIQMLQSLAAFAPKAKVHGVVDRYEVRYNGDLEDMSPSLRKLAVKSNKQLYEETKGTEYEISNGRVTSEYRVEGKNLNVDELELKVYLSYDLACGIGDKAVYAAQMKTVQSSIFDGNITTESGTKVDAMFSAISISNRIVNSPYLMGTTNRLLKHISTKISDIYFNSGK